MKKLKKAISFFIANMAFIGALLISGGFIVADVTPAPQSIGVALIFLHPFFNNGIKAGVRNFYTNIYAAAMAIYYLLIVLSIFHLGNLPLYGQLVLMQVPLIMIPFGLSGKKSISTNQINIVFVTLIAAVLVAGIASFINYLLHFQEIQVSITHSKPIHIVTGINHIYYSVLLAFCAGILQWKIFVTGIEKVGYKKLAWAALIIIVIILHTISARTGLFCFYAEAMVSIFWLVFKSKKIWAGVFIALGLAALAIITIKTVPSEENRFNNTEVDLHKYESGANVNHYSVSMRFEALKAGYALFKRHILTGVGPANVPSAMDHEYTLEHSDLIEMNRIKPHNEFLYALVSMGIIGGIALCFMIFLPFFTGAGFHDYLFLMFIVVCAASFQTEYLLERQVGITFFCLFYTLLAKRGKQSDNIA